MTTPLLIEALTNSLQADFLTLSGRHDEAALHNEASNGAICALFATIEKPNPVIIIDGECTWIERGDER